MFSRFVITLALVCAAVRAFQPAARRFNAVKLSMSETETPTNSDTFSAAPKAEASEQTVKDLNLEEMFEVFEEADQKVSTPTSPKKSSFDAKSMVGSSAPLGFFDPAGFTKGVTKDQYAFFQEAELKHGRVSMLAFLGLVFGELLAGGGLGLGSITGPAIYQYQQADASVFPLTATFLLGIGYIEQKGEWDCVCSAQLMMTINSF
jgi:hypothetical protein